MTIRIIILFLVILLCIFFKYYLSKYLYIKTNLFENFGDGTDAHLQGNFTYIESDINATDASINLLLTEIKEQNIRLTKTAGDLVAQQDALTKIQNAYKQLELYYNQLLTDNTERINSQKSTSTNATQDQKQVNAQIQAIYVAENTCITISETAQQQKLNVDDYNAKSKIAAEKGSTTEVNTYNTLIDQAVQIITDSKTIINNYANIANSSTANAALSIYNDALKLSKDIQATTNDNTELSINVKTAFDYATKASEKLNTVTDPKNTSIKDSQAAVDYIKEQLRLTDEIKKKYTTSTSIAQAHQICKTSLELANRDLTNEVDVRNAKEAVNNIRTALIDTAKKNDEAELAYLKSFIQVPNYGALIMQYQMNKNDGSGSVKNQINGRYDLNSRQNIWLSATIRNEYSRLGDGIMDSTTGYAGILSGYHFAETFTICFWFQYRGPANAGIIYLSRRGHYDYNRQNAVRVILNNQGSHYTGITVQYLVNGRDITESRFRNKTPLLINTWHHVSIVVDLKKRNKNIFMNNNKIYINGKDDTNSDARNRGYSWHWHWWYPIFNWNDRSYSDFLNIMRYVDMIYIAALPEQGVSNIYLDLLLIYNRELDHGAINEIYNIKALNQESFSTLENMTGDTQDCKGSYGQTIMDQSPQYLRFTCPAEKPACKGFEEGIRWGKCSKTTVNMKAVNMCARSFWEHNDHTDPVKCPYFQPYCAGHVGGVKYGQCYPSSNIKYFDSSYELEKV